MLVTADCVDPTYNKPVIDSQRDLTSPVPVHLVSGHFDGTTGKFNFYFPPKSQWQDRFFQFVYPLHTEDALNDPDAAFPTVPFAAASGAYTVQTNETGSGYRIDAAAAKYSKTVAASYYGTSRRIYGYVYGGSGGSFQTISAIENTTGVWDGAIPYIIGSPEAIPNTFFSRAFAQLVLFDQVGQEPNAAPQIADAVAPGGSGNPFAGLDAVQRAALLEVTRMGIPLRAWENYPYVLRLFDPGSLLSFGSTVQAIDPTYADDFWSKPGYLGTEQSALGDLFRAAKIDLLATITQVNGANLTLDSAPPTLGPTGFPLDFTLYGPDGTTQMGTLTGTLNPDAKTFTLSGSNPTVTAGDKLRIDNRWSLALTVYHRYQVPQQRDFYPWDQFRDQNGNPIYPQRGGVCTPPASDPYAAPGACLQIGPLISSSVTGGGTFTGKINGKVILVDNLLDTDAFAWPGDWYAKRVQANLGDRFDDNFRVWFNDHAHHVAPTGPGIIQNNLIDYGGILEQGLRDLSAWVEKGKPAPESTRYQVVNSQVIVPPQAQERRGIQPVVDLTVNGGSRIDVRAGQTVTFRAEIDTPPGAGKIAATAWDFLDTNNYTPTPFGPPRPRADVEATFTYNQPGTYFASLQVTEQRRAKDVNSPFTQVQNLGRVRVVVH
jgi:PKD domain